MRTFTCRCRSTFLYAENSFCMRCKVDFFNYLCLCFRCGNLSLLSWVSTTMRPSSSRSTTTSYWARPTSPTRRRTSRSHRLLHIKTAVPHHPTPPRKRGRRSEAGRGESVREGFLQCVATGMVWLVTITITIYFPAFQEGGGRGRGGGVFSWPPNAEHTCIDGEKMHCHSTNKVICALNWQAQVQVVSRLGMKDVSPPPPGSWCSRSFMAFRFVKSEQYPQYKHYFLCSCLLPPNLVFGNTGGFF